MFGNFAMAYELGPKRIPGACSDRCGFRTVVRQRGFFAGYGANIRNLSIYGELDGFRRGI